MNEPAANEPLKDTDPMPFGKFKGKPMQDVNAHYLNWLWNNGMKSEQTLVANYIRENLDCLKSENADQIWD